MLAMIALMAISAMTAVIKYNEYLLKLQTISKFLRILESKPSRNKPSQISKINLIRNKKPSQAQPKPKPKPSQNPAKPASDKLGAGLSPSQPPGGLWEAQQAKAPLCAPPGVEAPPKKL